MNGFVFLVALACVFIALTHEFSLNSNLAMRPRCTSVKIKECQKLGYNSTRMIDLYSSEGRNLYYNGKKYIQLLPHTNCSNFVLFFLCSVYSPICFEGHKEPILPCKSLCNHVRKRCYGMMKAHNIRWPKELECKGLPEHNSDVCIQPNAFLLKKKGNLYFYIHIYCLF